MTPSNPPSPVDIFRALRGVQAWAALAVPAMGLVAGALWFTHQGVQAQAVQLGAFEVRLTQIETAGPKIDKIAEDVTAIREALGVERGWRQGLLQSRPKQTNGTP